MTALSTVAWPTAVLGASRLADCAARYEADDARQLPPEVVASLVDAGFARHFVPGRWGGAEGGFASLVDAAATVGEVCASTAWCATLFAAHGRIAAYLPEEAQREIWAQSPDTLIAAAVVPPAGEAVAAPGGWRLHGEWSRASGLDFADWVLVATEVAGVVRIFALPAADCAIRDTWRAVGMRGTGSNTVVLDGVFVPEHRTVALGELLRSSPDEPLARCYNVPYPLVAALMFAAPLVGVAKGALAAWLSAAGPRAPGDSVVQYTFARSSAESHAAALLLREAAARADRGPVGERSVGANRRDAAMAVEMCVSAVDRLFAAHGSRAIADGDPVQRRWRDIHTAATHAALRFAPAAAAYAHAELG